MITGNNASSQIHVIKTTIEPKKQASARHYGIHPYFTTRAYNVIQEYISAFTKQGDIVLDPFCGTGITCIESLVLKRKTIGVDIAPLATFITKNIAISPVNINLITEKFKEIKNNIAEEIINMNLLSNKDAEKSLLQFKYPTASLPINSDVNTVDKLFTAQQLLSLSLLRDNIKKISNNTIRSLFLLAFSATVVTTNKMFRRRSSSPFAQYRYWMPKKKEKVNIWMTEVWPRFEGRVKRLIKAKEETNLLIGEYYNEEETFKIYNQSATDLNFIEDNSIDYIHTDPPYGAHIAYLDLCTMFHEWLEFKVSDEFRKLEMIEGGDLNKSRGNYINLFQQSVHEMYRVLKPNRYCSLIFQHKDVELWNAIVNIFRSTGFEYINCIAQPTKLYSWHKVKNPLSVVSGELVLNFKKAQGKGFYFSTDLPLDKVILNSVEKTIIQKDGATLDEIYLSLVPELLETGLLDLAESKIKDVRPLLLDNDFVEGRNGKWYFKEHKELGTFIPVADRMRFYIQSFLIREKKATLEDIRNNVFPRLINGKTPSDEEFIKIVKSICTSTDRHSYQLIPRVVYQYPIFHTHEAIDVKDIVNIKKDINPHTEMILRLCNLGRALGFDIWLGKKEQSTKIFKGILNLEKLQLLNDYPISSLDTTLFNKVVQIDVTWFYKTTPVYAFEVEQNTPIKDALDRFKHLIQINQNLAINRRLVIITPANRARKLTAELFLSVYVGDPFYLDRKVKYIFSSELIKQYDDWINQGWKVRLSDIDTITHDPRDLKNNKKTIP